MRVEVIRDATILLPNADHKNFTESGDYIPKGKLLDGEFKEILGKRRGQPFKYRLFRTNKGNIIFENNVKPIEMTTTEVTLGADSQVAPTKVTMPNAEKFRNAHIIGAVVGGAGMFYLAKKKGKTGTTPYKWAILGAGLGYVAGRLIAGKPIIAVSSPKMSYKY